jgi:uncharacterized repeat protein (TIGR01451 family)
MDCRQPITCVGISRLGGDAPLERPSFASASHGNSGFFTRACLVAGSLLVLQLLAVRPAWATHGINASCVAGRAPSGPFSATAGVSVQPGQDILVKIFTSNHDQTFPGFYEATFTTTLETNMFFGPGRVIHTRARWGGGGLGTGGGDDIVLATAGRPDGLQNVVIRVTSDVTGSKVLAKCDFPLFIVAPSSADDTDGDGLLDVWETGGFDADGDGTIDVDLPGFGATALHKDLFLELDWLPGQAPNFVAVRSLKAAFARAPINAGGRNNPDGRPGINLWVDTGGLRDWLSGSLVGDDLGGGNEIPYVRIESIELNSNYWAARADHFAGARRAIFRYAISADFGDSNPKMGGQGETGGNDFVDFNHDGGTLMHELGHNLGLDHGGQNDADNCKPNYVSVMNYDHQYGIRLTYPPDFTVIDYSPVATILGSGEFGRAPRPLPDLVESWLHETEVLDESKTSVVQFVFVNGRGEKVRQPVNQLPDWDGDGAITPFPMSVNIDTGGGWFGSPKPCVNDEIRDFSRPLRGANDWINIKLPFRGFGDSNAGPINPERPDNPTLQELTELEEQLNTTDLGIVISGSPNPVAAGTQLTYTVTVNNFGPNPASKLSVTITLPTAVTHVADTGGCTAMAGQSLTCPLSAELLARYNWTFSVTVAVAADVQQPNSGAVTLRTRARAQNGGWPDSDHTNNEAEFLATVKVQVAIDIRPRQPTNVIVLRSRTPTQVAILSSSVFDALTVDPRTVTLAGAPVEQMVTGRPVIQTVDVNRDGLLDLVVSMQTAAMQLTPTDTQAVVEGATFSGGLLIGVDSVTVVPRGRVARPGVGGRPSPPVSGTVDPYAVTRLAGPREGAINPQTGHRTEGREADPR